MSRFASFAQRSFKTSPRASRGRVSARADIPMRGRFSTLELLENRTLLSTYQVTNLNDTGDGSLRAAITAANASAGADTITFDTSLAGSINLASGLPAITDQVSIVGNTDGHGVPIVAINGAGLDVSDFSNGLELDGASRGGTADGSSVSGLSVINFSNATGIDVHASGVMLSGDYVGLAPGYASAANPTLTNNSSGIVLSGSGNTVQGSVVANSLGNGIQVAGSGNQLLGNFVGTDPSGSMVLANFGNGVELRNASYTVVRGNVIASNQGNGVRVVNSDHSTIAGNLIGTDALGDAGNGNGGDGVVLDTNATFTTVGGGAAADRNVISGNSANGVNVKSGAGVGNVVEGNYLGTDASGTVAIPNVGNGANIGGSGVLVTGNLLSGNFGNGISINGNNNTVVRNFIGTAADGASPLGGNGGSPFSDGVYVQGYGNAIGAAGAGNVIAYNENAGVVVFVGSGNAVRYNSVYANGNIGIDLGDDGHTLNDSLPHDGTNNNYQDFPLITGIKWASDGSLLLSGTVYGDHEADYTVDVYTTDAVDAGLNGQGRHYLGSFVVHVDASGHGDFANVSLAAPAAGDSYVVATATDEAGNTSEFSLAAALPAASVAVDTTTTLSSDQDPANYGSTVTFTATVTGQGGSLAPTGTVSFYEMVNGVGHLLGTGTLASDGTATFATNGLSLGHHMIVAVYNADPGFNGSSSTALDQAVTDFSVTILSSSTTISQPGQSVSFTAVVSPGTAGSGTPTGSVIFYDGNTAISGSVTLVTDSNGVTSAVFTTTSLSVGTHVITAVYGGDDNYGGSTSNSLNETVKAPPPTSTISGHVYRDASGNGLSADDTALAGVTVKLFKDANNNGVYDSGDTLVTSAVSGVDGNYSFSGLANGRYFVVETVPTGYLQTAPATTSYYTENATGTTYTADFDNFMKCGCSANVVNIWYTISGCGTKYTDLRGHTHEGDTVTVHFTVLAHHTETLSFVSYTAPGSSFDANTASQQVIYNYQTGTFTAGSTNKTFAMTVKIPKCDYQIDLVCGQMIDKFGPAGSNIFYTPQGRLFSADNGGTHSPFGIKPIGGTVLSE